MTEIDTLFLLLCTVMVFVMQAGFLCLEVGVSRASSAGHVALKNLSEIATVGLIHWAVGFGLMFGSSHFGLIGSGPFAMDMDNAHIEISPDILTILMFQIAFATTAVSIISGAVAERCSYRGYLLVTALVAGIVYPIIGHAIWGGTLDDGRQGWLAELGFVDFAGATVVHSTGGWAALAAIIFIGARRGRFGRNRPGRFAPSSVGLSTLGATLLWLGWFGFNAGSALAFNEATPIILAKTVLAAAGGMICGMIFSAVSYGHVRPYVMLSGMLAGLVASTGGIHIFTTAEMLIVGMIGAALCYACANAMERAKIDDPVQAVPVHLAAGIWGTLAVGIYGDPSGLPTDNAFEQVAIQAIGVVYCALVGFGGTMLLMVGLNKLVRLRVPPRAEVVGIDKAEHGITAPVQNYREFQEAQAVMQRRFESLARDRTLDKMRPDPMN